MGNHWTEDCAEAFHLTSEESAALRTMRMINMFMDEPTGGVECVIRRQGGGTFVGQGRTSEHALKQAIAQAMKIHK